jgi:hypothetical protein
MAACAASGVFLDNATEEPFAARKDPPRCGGITRSVMTTISASEDLPGTKRPAALRRHHSAARKKLC